MQKSSMWTFYANHTPKETSPNIYNNFLVICHEKTDLSL